MLPALLPPSLLLAAADGFNPFEFVPGATFWTWVIFLGSLVPMWKFVFGPITKALADRDAKLENAIAAADDARRRAEEQVAAAKTELEKARGDAKRMVEDATARAERQAQDALAKAKDEAERQLRRARDEIAAEKHKALAEIRNEVVDLTIKSTGRLLRRNVDDDAHKKVVPEFLRSLHN
jgi:F-type H+-transporting ATPase subunit b